LRGSDICKGDLAVVRRAQLFERRHNVEARAARVKRVVVRDLGSVEHESDPPVREVKARRQLGVALVGAVAEPQEPADARRGVVHVEVHRFVEVGGLLQLVHVLVLGFEPDLHARIGAQP
jgi:hypothetical protein